MSGLMSPPGHCIDPNCDEMLAMRGSRPAASSSTSARAADGWGGDGYHQWFDGANAAFLLVYEGDTDADLRELEDALLDFAIQSVPEEAFVWVDSRDGQLFFIAASVVEIGEQIRSSVGLG